MPNTAPEKGGDKPLISVACGVLLNARGEVLLAQRPQGKIAAGYWELPGGKIEPGETAAAALARELHEELGVTVRSSRPLIRVRHEYSNRSVILDTWLVRAFDGEPQGRESQAFEWLPPQRFGERQLLPTVGLILPALQLPADYVFTPPDADERYIRQRLPALPVGALLRLRLPQLDERGYETLVQRLLPECRALGLKLMLDREPQQAAALGAGGWHATVARLAALQERPLSASFIVAGSAHAPADLARLQQLGADCAVLGTVLATPSHPDQAPLGWVRFEDWATRCNLPVYAIGGAGPRQRETAFSHYAQGVAGISAYWRE